MPVLPLKFQSIIFGKSKSTVTHHWSFASQLGSVYTYIFFDMSICIMSSEHWTSESEHAERRGLSIHTPLRHCQCVGRWTCPPKVRTSLRAHPSNADGGPTEVNRSVFT